MKPRTLILVGLGLLAVPAIAAVWWQWPVRVQTTLPTRGPAIEAVYATGTVEPTVMVPVAPRAGGRLLSVDAEEGQQVKRGQVLARIESSDLDQTVQEMRAREQLARLQYERARSLVEQQFVARAELDRTRMEWQAADAAVRRAQAQRDYTQLVAPADGIVLRRDGEAGQFVPAGQTVFALACCAPLRVTAEVDEEDIARVMVGQTVMMRSDALPQRLYEGRVAEITPKGDPVSRSYRVRVRLVDAPPIEAGPMRSGMTMDTNVIVSRREGALLVPNRAIQGDRVWLLASGRLNRRSVVKGIVGSDRTEIVSGLADGDAVVLSPSDALREGQRAHGTLAPPDSPASAALASE
ncbi:MULTISPECIES: efflux RND transporter periplasmic adaptor subunit [unclassified Variovorax]|uniref:efflux RND transporter periplasmic adaptor subunit n=1 Tax=unclassified Variovorax TaxID=663243 RepID=UPI00076D5B6B|nr:MULTISPECIES: efflux RND transporter periplasmic adaptor subunit [unclassified Variovorax]KWT96818.1 membrane fusion protein [Variovorax sp. WDL1]PNG47199.1 Macrolide export protein MacA [Variovorax sp. B2]PNG48150.1 Macrolide export protein MacA [Variovorax sp. B4]VTV15079.1 Macrolide-specific efflux protein MacA precursor [Variovorax sp. WDL1]